MSAADDPTAALAPDVISLSRVVDSLVALHVAVVKLPLATAHWHGLGLLPNLFRLLGALARAAQNTF